MQFKSVTAGGADTIESLEKPLREGLEAFPVKFYWFLSKGYQPHLWQMVFHTARQQSDGNICRFRHLVAGRRGGKTLSAAWEMLFYMLHPAEFHRDMHGVESDRPLWAWALAKDFQTGRPALLTFLEVMSQAGLIKDRDYRYNKTEKTIEFMDSGSLLEFKTADDPQSLRGAGLDFLWIDEGAFVRSNEAWNVVRPALSDKLGRLITTTTPMGKNWYHDEFWSDRAKADDAQFRVEYTSIDNPFFPREEWDYAKTHLHPVVFKREYMASFDAMAGVELDGEWLKYYVVGEGQTLGSPDDIRLLPKDGKHNLRTYIGIDPAVSLADSADHFAMALVGVAEDNSFVYILETFKGRLPFPEQLNKISEWNLKYRPQFIGIESNAFQRALEQQASRLPNFPPVIPVFNKAKKVERIMGMAPLFRIGKVRIHRTQYDFIDEWVSYDSTIKNPKDDLLDAVEIALGTAGVLLPPAEQKASTLTFLGTEPTLSIDEEAREQIRMIGKRDDMFDEELGTDW